MVCPRDQECKLGACVDLPMVSIPPTPLDPGAVPYHRLQLPAAADESVAAWPRGQGLFGGVVIAAFLYTLQASRAPRLTSLR